jgi:hypothetical protein
MRFVGATTVYAFMQSAGLVNDHLAACHRSDSGNGRRRTTARPRPAIPKPHKLAKKPKGPR